MRLLFATLAMALLLAATALAQSDDLRAPDQQAAPQQPGLATDLRAPDPQAAPQQPGPATDLRTPDQVAPAPPRALTTDLRAPDQVVPAPPAIASIPESDGGPGAIVFVLIGLGAAIVLLASGYLGVRYRHRVAIADDLAVE
jgi:hypothetical protein